MSIYFKLSDAKELESYVNKKHTESVARNIEFEKEFLEKEIKEYDLDQYNIEETPVMTLCRNIKNGLDGIYTSLLYLVEQMDVLDELELSSYVLGIKYGIKDMNNIVDKTFIDSLKKQTGDV